ncbi:19608_t:CDS:2, partial [Racocetra persica]
YLEQVSKSVSTICSAMQPARNPVDNSNIKIHIEYFRQDIKECYNLLATKMRNTDDYKNTPAVHDRCHGITLYMPLFISIRDLKDTIVSRLNQKKNENLIEEFLIPSEQWIALQFYPKNP